MARLAGPLLGVSVRECARQLGISDTAILKAIKAERCARHALTARREPLFTDVYNPPSLDPNSVGSLAFVTCATFRSVSVMRFRVPPRRGATREQGFTLIELMIVVTVAAILATMAMPAYTRMINKSRAKDAAADLASLGLNMENRFQLQLSYPVNAAGTVIGSSSNSTFTGWAATQLSHFAYTLASDAGSYTLTATGKGGLAGCTVTLNSTNSRDATTACGFTTW